MPPSPLSFSGSLTGDIAKLEVFGNRVAKAGSVASLRGLSKAIGAAALFEIQVGFSTQTDPYGDPWKPKVIPDGRPANVGATGRMRAGWYLKYVGPDAVIVGNRTRQSKFSTGTGVYGPTGRPITPKVAKALSFKVAGRRFAFRSVRGAPPRLMVPRPGDMPFRWNKAITVAAQAYMRERLQGR